jgi:hypothetical protein
VGDPGVFRLAYGPGALLALQKVEAYRYLATASSFGITWSTLSMVLVMSISFLAARRGRICFGRDSLVLDKDLLGLGDGLRTPGCGESQRNKAQ